VVARRNHGGRDGDEQDKGMRGGSCIAHSTRNGPHAQQVVSIIAPSAPDGPPIAFMSDGSAFSRLPSCGCADDSIGWGPAVFGNVLTSSGRGGDELLTVVKAVDDPYGLRGMTNHGFIIGGTQSSYWSAGLDDRSIFEVVASTPERA